MSLLWRFYDWKNLSGDQVIANTLLVMIFATPIVLGYKMTSLIESYTGKITTAFIALSLSMLVASGEFYYDTHLQNRERYQHNWENGGRTPGVGTADFLKKWLMTTILSAISFTPTWVYLSISQISPKNTWQQFLMVDYGLIAIGIIQLFLLATFLSFCVRIWICED